MRSGAKKGISLASLVVYVMLFAMFTVFVSNISGNLNEKLFDNRGEAINYSSLNKLQYNICDSGAKSSEVFVSSNDISFSNGDTYVYDDVKQVIFKNGGVLCTNVSSFSVMSQASGNSKKLTIDVNFNKYLNSLSRTIICCVEEL